MCWQCLYHIFQNTTHHVLSVRNEKYFVQSSGKIRKTFYKEFYMNLWFRFYYYTIYGWKNNIKKTLLNLNGIFKSAEILHFNCGHFNVFSVISEISGGYRKCIHFTGKWRPLQYYMTWLMCTIYYHINAETLI